MHPASFKFKWHYATRSERENYMRLTEVICPQNERESCFLLWMAGESEEMRETFLQLWSRGGKKCSKK